jgi:Bacterial pre-peptidase C-terminal domain
MVRYADPHAFPPDVTAFWSPLNSPAAGGAKEAAGSTYFDVINNTISFIGDRSTDSDEFDDAVIVHEYGHLVAAALSRDSSPGGVHILGDALDPRVAWSEGWANFFSSAVRNNPIYRDSYGPNGSSVLRYDLRDDIPQGDQPGYWSEFSVHSILWDLFGSKSDDSDSIEQSIQTIFPAFEDLKQDHFVYLPYFLEHLLNRNPNLTDLVSVIARSRSVDFHNDIRPSISNPFPQPIDTEQLVTGTVDSFSTRRKDLLHSSDFVKFQTAGGRTSIRMDITGLGPGNNPNANDLDIFLYDVNGQLVGLSDGGKNGESELIPAVLPAGTYIVEVRSYYDRGDTKKGVFNSGTYRLIVRTQL